MTRTQSFAAKMSLFIALSSAPGCNWQFNPASPEEAAFWAQARYDYQYALRQKWRDSLPALRAGMTPAEAADVLPIDCNSQLPATSDKGRQVVEEPYAILTFQDGKLAS